jgi:hypothetical protein
MARAVAEKPKPDIQTTTAAPPASTDSAMVANFKAARRVSTPIVAIETPDPASTIAAIRKTLPDKTPVMSWDCARGLVGLDQYGKAAVSGALAAAQIEQAQTVNATETLLACLGLPGESVVFMYNLHRQLNAGLVEAAPCVQALWNLRDPFKVNRRMIVPLAPTFKIPPELTGDIIVLDEPLPTRDELSKTIDQQHKNADLPLPEEETRAAALDALVGLPYFTSEQAYAMALTKKGVVIPQLWNLKIKAIQSTPGLRVWRAKPGDTSIDELQGIDNVVSFMQKLILADAFGAIVFIDEMDKAFAGGMSDHTGDSGVSKDQVGTILSYIEDTGSLGVLLAGVAGTGKTQLAKATGVAAGKPVIVFDLGGMKGGTVGQSEEQIRNALKVVTATAEGRVLFLGTANRTTMFTPELNRRFPDQFFYDVPDEAGRRAIWQVYINKLGLRESQAEIPLGFDRGWTGAEIKRACERAVLFGDTVVDAARYIIPSSVSGKKAIMELRMQAQDRFLSASYEGYYRIPEEPLEPIVNRSIEVH